MCREAFAKPKAFAAILGIPVRYVNNARTMIALMNSKKAKVNPEKFEEYGDAHLQDMESDPKYSWNKNNPSVCKIFYVQILTLDKILLLIHCATQSKDTYYSLHTIYIQNINYLSFENYRLMYHTFTDRRFFVCCPIHLVFLERMDQNPGTKC